MIYELFYTFKFYCTIKGFYEFCKNHHRELYLVAPDITKRIYQNINPIQTYDKMIYKQYDSISSS